MSSSKNNNVSLNDPLVESPNELLEEAPNLPVFDVEIQLNERHAVVDKLTLWQRKLLDLTTRNRLLHLPFTAKYIKLICPEPSVLEDKLAGGKSIRVVAMPDLEKGGRDTELYLQQNSESLQEEYAKIVLGKGEVLAAFDKNKLASSLVELYRKARSDLDEGGANTLFLAIGFLQWKKSPDDPRSYMAPLILLPIKLERKSALSGVSMRMLEEEPRFNLTLLELLRHDFALNIPELESELPTDGGGVDVAGIWNIMRRAVRDIPGFEVKDELVIGTFSFAKYLMWKDLVNRSDQLFKNPLVKYLIERGSGQEALPVTGEFLSADVLDQKITASELFLPLPIDSSQLSAVVASASGRDFVLDGPPGTGKSQTIANMIAHNLGLGRRVLFVAEKKAALEVVYRRLEEKGLGEFCIELHSSKTSKTDFLKQLERAWDTRDVLSAEQWREEALTAQHLRDKLNKIVKVLHNRWPNGLTVYQAMGKVIRDADKTTPKLQWPAGTLHDSEIMTKFRDIARRLDLNSDTAQRYSAEFSFISHADWTNGWQEQIVAVADQLPCRIDELDESIASVISVSGLAIDSKDYRNLSKSAELLALLLDAYAIDLAFAFAPDAGTKLAIARNAVKSIEAYHEEQTRLSATYSPDCYRHINIEQIASDWHDAEQKFWLLGTLARKKVCNDLIMQGGVSGTPNISVDVARLRSIKVHLNEIDGVSLQLQSIPGWNAQNTDLPTFTGAIALAERIRAMISTVALSAPHLAALRTSIATLIIDSNELLNPDGQLALCIKRLKRALVDVEQSRRQFAELTGGITDVPVDSVSLKASAEAVVKNQMALKSWCDWCRVRNEADSLGLNPLTTALAEDALPHGQVRDIFETAYSRWFAAWVIDAEPLLHNFVPAEHMSDIESYRKQDNHLSQLAVRYIKAKLCGSIPAKNEIGKSGGFGVLKHELQKSRRHKPVRQLAAEMGDAMSKLAPCMLMSPLSIAQFMPAEQPLFDLVIFDEASQITPWDAIGVIARGKQVVIAGDPRQMPPTNFFNRGSSESEDDTEEDMESILDECLAAGIHNHSLSWHYRSRHESLIAFSNNRYYDNNLITFPSAQTKVSAVEWRRISGVYAKGKGRHNQAEAEAIVAEIVRRLTDSTSQLHNQSIGVITLNTEQQKLISDLLDKARQRNPSIEPYFQEDIPEPVVVKNLETMQGDERDVIMLGIGYGPTELGANTMSMNFGPLNKEGGWRRLNVAITRARQEMLIFTSFDPSMIDLNRTSARAVQDLRYFIEFAQRGPVALAQAIKGSVGSYESPFEEAVAQGLRQKGWNVVPQIGVSRFRIDLGIVHPDCPGDYLVGVECDGATYHSAATARDRDKVRSAILQGLGWRLLRVWSTDWWVDKQGALERLHRQIGSLLEQSRNDAALIKAAIAEKTRGESSVEAGRQTETADFSEQMAEESVSLSMDTDHAEQAAEIQGDALTDVADLDKKVAGNFGNAPERRIAEHDHDKYHLTDFTSLQNIIAPDKFYEASYDPILRDLIVHVLQQEAPILDTLLVQRIARAHGFNRAGRLIRERVLAIVDANNFIKADSIDGDFVWLSKEQSIGWHTARLPVTEDDIRSMNEIATEEIYSLIRTENANCGPADIAKLFGLRRVTSSAKDRIEAVNKLHGSQDDAEIAASALPPY
jgi:very-short-patch-repair endonuclease